MAVMRYVDDYFCAEREGTEAHAMQCFARMVRAIMGASVLNKDKLESGVQLDVLGLTISYDQKGVQVRVNQKKAEQWSQLLVYALGCKALRGGEAGRLAGRLHFAAQKTFKRNRGSSAKTDFSATVQTIVWEQDSPRARNGNEVVAACTHRHANANNSMEPFH